MNSSLMGVQCSADCMGEIIVHNFSAHAVLIAIVQNVNMLAVLIAREE